MPKRTKPATPSRVEDGPAILNYTGRRVPIAQVHGGLAMKKTAGLARLRRRKLIRGRPESLVEVKVGKWRKPRNLR
jgi:hypothetical protein